MLDYIKLMRALENVSQIVSHDIAHEHAIANSAWQAMVRDPALVYKLRERFFPWDLPTWQGNLDQVETVKSCVAPYNALSVDGSQIYPDRHQGTSWYLINVGSVAIAYDAAAPRVMFETVPTVFTGEDEQAFGGHVGVDNVNCRRQELELAAGISWYQALGELAQKEQVLFYDGSLVFWHIASKEAAHKEVMMARYGALLEKMRDAQMLVAGYISAPKSKDLVHVAAAWLMLEGTCADAQQAQDMLEHVTDASLLQGILKPGERTTLFCPTLSLCDLYPQGTRPYFFYMHVGSEVIRIEVPAWVACSQELVDAVAMISYDQAVKGQGYPVVIAEAHEQAVVRGADRDFFYQMIDKVGGQRGRLISQKSIKKRSMGI